MSSLGRTVLLWMIPVNLMLIAWVWFGRFLFGVAAAQLTVWGAMFAGGLLTPDYGDTPESARSVLTQVFGYSDALYDLSYLLTSIAAALTVAAWIALVATLTAGRRSRDLVTPRS